VLAATKDTAHALWKRTWARGVTVTNTWNGFGQIVEKRYSDGTPGFEVESYNALGQPVRVYDDVAGSTYHTYTDDGDPLLIYWENGPLWGLIGADQWDARALRAGIAAAARRKFTARPHPSLRLRQRFRAAECGFERRAFGALRLQAGLGPGRDGHVQEQRHHATDHGEGLGAWLPAQVDQQCRRHGADFPARIHV
jgi:YD repeat-containing protein